MPEVVGTFKTPRLAAAPSTPSPGQMYFDTVTNALYWHNGTSWNGSQGATGAPGSVIYSGQGTPPTNTGIAGDYWLDTLTSIMYGPKGSIANSASNLVPNPSLETNLTGWTTTASSGTYPTVIRERTTDWAVHGSWSYHVNVGAIPSATKAINMTPTGVSAIPVDPAKKYSWQVTHRLRSFSSLSGTVVPRIGWYQANGTASAILATQSGGAFSVQTGDVVRITMSNVLPPSDAAFAAPLLQVSSCDYWDSDTDAAIFVEGAVLPTEWPSTGVNLAAARTFRTGHTWAIPGALLAASLPPIFVPEASLQASTIVGVRAKIGSGTNITAQIQNNGTNLGSSFAVTTTATTTAFSQAITNADALGLVLSAPTGSPTDLSLTLFLEHIV